MKEQEMSAAHISSSGNRSVLKAGAFKKFSIIRILVLFGLLIWSSRNMSY